jgi:hypothetical protein
MKVFVSNNGDPYSSKLGQLDQRAESLRIRLLEISAEKRTHALAATDGDAAAIKKIAALDEEQLMASRELDLISSAQSDLEAKRHEQDEIKAKEARAKNEAEAKELVISIMAANTEVDRLLNDLCNLFKRRHGLLIALEKTKVMHLPNRLVGSKFSATGAAKAAGLHAFLSLEHVPTEHAVPLVESNKLISVIKPAPPPKPQFTPAPKMGERYIG